MPQGIELLQVSLNPRPPSLLGRVPCSKDLSEIEQLTVCVCVCVCLCVYVCICIYIDTPCIGLKRHLVVLIHTVILGTNPAGICCSHVRIHYIAIENLDTCTDLIFLYSFIAIDTK